MAVHERIVVRTHLKRRLSKILRLNKMRVLIEEGIEKIICWYGTSRNSFKLEAIQLSVAKVPHEEHSLDLQV